MVRRVVMVPREDTVRKADMVPREASARKADMVAVWVHNMVVAMARRESMAEASEEDMAGIMRGVRSGARDKAQRVAMAEDMAAAIWVVAMVRREDILAEATVPRVDTVLRKDMAVAPGVASAGDMKDMEMSSALNGVAGMARKVAMAEARDAAAWVAAMDRRVVMVPRGATAHRVNIALRADTVPREGMARREDMVAVEAASVEAMKATARARSMGVAMDRSKEATTAGRMSSEAASRGAARKTRKDTDPMTGIFTAAGTAGELTGRIILRGRMTISLFY
jgi:hypothetical protein